MRRLNLVQDIAAGVDEHWRVFLDDAFERALYVEALRFPKYELLESKQTDETIKRKIRVTPKLDAPAAVLKILGDGFGYVEESSFDRKTKVLRSKITPNVLGDRISCAFVVRADPAGEDRCKRNVEVTIEAKIFGVGGLVETVFEKSMRDGWRDSARFLDEWVRRSRSST